VKGLLVFSAESNDGDKRIYAMNGKSVEVDNTDAEGRLVLSGLSDGSMKRVCLSADLRRDM
jgi:hypothetical protein